jgi:GxxExxY protein
VVQLLILENEELIVFVKIMLRSLQKIFQSAKEVYRVLGTGHSEAVYHKAMEVELRLNGFKYSTKSPVSILYKNHIVGYNEPDLLVYPEEDGNPTIVVELKATTYPPRETEKAQLDSYLRNLKTNYGILINFPQPTSKTDPINIHFLNYGFEDLQQQENFSIPTGIPTVPKVDLD